MLDWLIEQYRKENPDMTIDDVVAMATADWEAYEQDMKGESPWQ